MNSDGSSKAAWENYEAYSLLFLLSLISVSLLSTGVGGFGCIWSHSVELLWNRDRPVLLLPVDTPIDKGRWCITDRSIGTSWLLRNGRNFCDIHCHLACVFVAVIHWDRISTEFHIKILFTYPLMRVMFLHLMVDGCLRNLEWVIHDEILFRVLQFKVKL
jgi:hypothetical protein